VEPAVAQPPGGRGPAPGPGSQPPCDDQPAGPSDQGRSAGGVERPAPAFRRATAATALLAVAVGATGWLYQRHWGRLPWSVPSKPWYHAVPFYLFPGPQLAPRAAVVALPVVLLAAVAVVVLQRAAVAWRLRIAVSSALLLVIALAASALAAGPPSWWEPFHYDGEYPQAAGRIGAIPSFLREFPERLATLPSHAAGHPAGATVLYELLDRVWPGIQGAALLTVALGCLGAVNVAGLARDQLGEDGGRWALALWTLSPVVVLYTATSADAVFALVLAGAALASLRGLTRRSAAWTLAGGALLWLSSMLTYAAVLLLVFLLPPAAGRLRQERATVLRWAATTAGAVLALVGLLWLATGYDPFAAIAAVRRYYGSAPGSAHRPYAVYLLGDGLAFGAMLGVPLLAALAARALALVRERAWASVDAGALAMLLAGGAWGFSRGEVERIFLFMAPLLLVPAVRQLLAWRARMRVVAALLLAQTLAVQLLFFTRW